MGKRRSAACGVLLAKPEPPEAIPSLLGIRHDGHLAAVSLRPIA